MSGPGSRAPSTHSRRQSSQQGSSPMPESRRRRSSLVFHAEEGAQAMHTVQTGLEARVLRTEEEHRALLNQKLENGQEEEEGEEAADTLDPAFQDLLNIEPSARETQHVDSIADILSKSAVEWAQPFSDDQVSDVAKNCLYHFFPPDSCVCDADEETEL